MVLFLLIIASSGGKVSCINSKTAQPIDTEFGVPRIFRGEFFIYIVGLSWNCHWRAVMYLFFIDCCFSIASCLCDAILFLLNELYMTIQYAIKCSSA